MSDLAANPLHKWLLRINSLLTFYYIRHNTHSPVLENKEANLFQPEEVDTLRLIRYEWPKVSSCIERVVGERISKNVTYPQWCAMNRQVSYPVAFSHKSPCPCSTWTLHRAASCMPLCMLLRHQSASLHSYRRNRLEERSRRSPSPSTKRFCFRPLLNFFIITSIQI